MEPTFHSARLKKMARFALFSEMNKSYFLLSFARRRLHHGRSWLRKWEQKDDSVLADMIFVSHWIMLLLQGPDLLGEQKHVAMRHTSERGHHKSQRNVTPHLPGIQGKFLCFELTAFQLLRNLPTFMSKKISEFVSAEQNMVSCAVVPNPL